jgi:hypothetical protein
LDSPLRFGIFLPPMHRTGVNPTLALHRDLELMEHLDRLGYAEAWIGEHHSAGSELIASPEVFIATAAERTKHIKLGTGVNSLPYHHPFVLADRIVMLDHLTRGRMMFGAGPGQLTSDAMMLGIDPMHQRPRMEESLDVMMRLFAGETVTEKTDWFTCDEAVLQIRPYSDFDIAVASSISPSGSKLAGEDRQTVTVGVHQVDVSHRAGRIGGDEQVDAGIGHHTADLLAPLVVAEQPPQRHVSTEGHEVQRLARTARPDRFAATTGEHRARSSSREFVEVHHRVPRHTTHDESPKRAIRHHRRNTTADQSIA